MMKLIPSHILVLLGSSKPRGTDQQYCVDCWALLACDNTSRSYIFKEIPCLPEGELGSDGGLSGQIPHQFPSSPVPLLLYHMGHAHLQFIVEFCGLYYQVWLKNLW